MDDFERKMSVLRDYQIEVKRRLEEVWRSGKSRVMLQMPTGTGKTYVVAAVMRDVVGKSKEGEVDEKGVKIGETGLRVMVVAHRRELIEQMEETVRRYGMKEWLDDGTIVVTSVQKLAAQETQNKENQEVGRMERTVSPTLLVIDEAHHATAKTYRMLWERFPKAKVLGVTATPYRLNGDGFHDLFDTLISSWTVKQFIHEGYLALFDFVSVRPDGEMMKRVQGLKKRGVDGDYQLKEMGAVMDNRACIEQLYRSYSQYALGKKGIIYAINREHANHIATFYRQKGVNIAEVDASTPSATRKVLVEDYRAGGLDVIVNVDLFSEGLDCPDVEFIQLARPTRSLAKYLQQVGRGLRPTSGKEKTIILDNVGMYFMFGLPDEDWDWEAFFAGKGKNAIGGMTRTKKALLQKQHPVNMRLGHEDEMVMIRGSKVQSEDLANDHEEVSVYEEEQRFGLRQGTRLLTPAQYLSIGTFVGEYAVARSLDTEYGWVNFYVINKQGRAKLLGPHQHVELQDDGFAKVLTFDGRTIYTDLLTNTSIPCYPNEVKTVGWLHFARYGDVWSLRVKGLSYVPFGLDDLLMTGDAFQKRVRYNGKELTLYLNKSMPQKCFELISYTKDGRKILRNLSTHKYYLYSNSTGLKQTTMKGVKL